MSIKGLYTKFSKQNKKQKIEKCGIALSGGAALGISHIGVLKALEEYNIKPAVLAGTSAGALIGGMYAKGLSIKEMEAIARSIDRKKTVQLLSPKIQRGGLLDGQNFLEFLIDKVGEVNIEDLPLKFIAVAVDFKNGDILYINQGQLVHAIRASISIPGVFMPFHANNTLLVDGGVRVNLPLRVIKEFEHDFLLGVNVLKTKHLNLEGHFTRVDRDQVISDSDKNNFFKRIADIVNIGISQQKIQLPRLTSAGYQALKILLTELSNREIEINQPDLVIDVDVSHIKLWEFWQAKELIEIGYESARSQLANYFKQ